MQKLHNDHFFYIACLDGSKHWTQTMWLIESSMQSGEMRRSHSFHGTLDSCCSSNGSWFFLILISYRKCWSSVLTRLVPWGCVSGYLRRLVPDATPQHHLAQGISDSRKKEAENLMNNNSNKTNPQQPMIIQRMTSTSVGERVLWDSLSVVDNSSTILSTLVNFLHCKELLSWNLNRLLDFFLWIISLVIGLFVEYAFVM